MSAKSIHNTVRITMINKLVLFTGTVVKKPWSLPTRSRKGSKKRLWITTIIDFVSYLLKHNYYFISTQLNYIMEARWTAFRNVFYLYSNHFCEKNPHKDIHEQKSGLKY